MQTETTTQTTESGCTIETTIVTTGFNSREEHITMSTELDTVEPPPAWVYGYGEVGQRIWP